MLLRAALICVLLSVCLRDNVTARLLDSIRGPPEDEYWHKPTQSKPVVIDPPGLTLATVSAIDLKDIDLHEIEKEPTLSSTAQPLEMSDAPDLTLATVSAIDLKDIDLHEIEKEMTLSPPAEIDPADLRLGMNMKDTDLLELKKQLSRSPVSQPLKISDGEIPTTSEFPTTPQSEGLPGEVPTPSEFPTTPQSEGLPGEIPTPSEFPTTPQSKGLPGEIPTPSEFLTTPQSEETFAEEIARLGAESLNGFFERNCKECQRRCRLEGDLKFVCIFTCGVCTRFQKRSVQQPNDPKGHLTPMPNKFSAYDLDDDGVVSIKELAFVAGQGTDVKMVFDIADKDGDMQLTPQELYEGPFVFEMDVDESDYTYCEYLTKRMERSG